MAKFETLKALLKEVWEALKDILTGPVILLLLLLGVVFLILLYSFF
jgi:hypothetical protein